MMVPVGRFFDARNMVWFMTTFNSAARSSVEAVYMTQCLQPIQTSVYASARHNETAHGPPKTALRDTAVSSSKQHFEFLLSAMDHQFE
jgi:hypothetical protein